MQVTGKHSVEEMIIFFETIFYDRRRRADDFYNVRGAVKSLHHKFKRVIFAAVSDYQNVPAVRSYRQIIIFIFFYSKDTVRLCCFKFVRNFLQNLLKNFQRLFLIILYKHTVRNQFVISQCITVSKEVKESAEGLQLMFWNVQLIFKV